MARRTRAWRRTRADRFRSALTDLPDLGRNLADQLLVDASDRHPVRGRNFELDALRRPDVHGMGEPQGQLQVGVLHGSPVPHPHDLEALLIAVGDPDHHVRQQRPGQPVQRAVEPLVARPLHPKRAVLQQDPHVPVEVLLELALGALHGHARAINGDLHR
jgi:hypothetical protein